MNLRKSKIWFCSLFVFIVLIILISSNTFLSEWAIPGMYLFPVFVFILILLFHPKDSDKNIKYRKFSLFFIGIVATLALATLLFGSMVSINMI